MIGPIQQDPTYHAFADDRAFLGVANVADTLSSLMLLAVGMAGLLLLWRERTSSGTGRFLAQEEMLPYWALFACVALTGLGSAYYHLAPSDTRLIWDRLPMAAGFMCLLAAAIAERVSARVAMQLMVPFIALGMASVLYWPASAAFGFEDLRPYYAVQFGSLVAVLSLCAMFPSPYTKGKAIPAAIGVYGIAKLFELNDRQIYELGEWVSGHTLKHVTAAAAVYLLLWSLRHRMPRALQRND
jgi:hypothetical protein